MADRPVDLHEAPEGLPDDDDEDLPPRAFNEAYHYGLGDDDRLVSDISDRYPAPSPDDAPGDQPIVGEPSVKAIIERIRTRTKGSSADARNAAGSPPFARSSDFQTVGKPSFPPSRTVAPSVCYTVCLSLNGALSFAELRHAACHFLTIPQVWSRTQTPRFFGFNSSA